MRNTSPSRSEGAHRLLEMLPAIALLGGLFLLPLARLFLLGFTTEGVRPFVRLWEDGIYAPVLLETFRIAGIVTLVCLLIGYPTSWFLATTTGLWRAIGFAIVVFPLWTSVVVRTYAWMVILGRNGILNRLLLDLQIISEPIGLLNSEFAVVIGMAHVMLPFIILPIYSAATRIDPDLLLAARGLGASHPRIFLDILLPLTMSGVIAGATFVFVVSIGFYITPALLGGGKVMMIANLIEQQVIELLDWAFASALSLVLLAAAVSITWASKRLVASWIPK